MKIRTYILFAFAILAAVRSFSQNRFTLKGTLFTYSDNTEETDFRDRGLTLLKGSDTIVSHIITQQGEFSISDLDSGEYLLSFTNSFGQTVNRPVVIAKNTEDVSLRTDNFIDEGGSTFIDHLKPGDNIKLDFESTGCFHHQRSSLTIEAKASKLIITYQPEGKKAISRSLTKDDTEAVSLFERQMSQMKNSHGGCTTVDRYQYAMNGKPVLTLTDSSCEWNGYYQLIKKLFNI